MPIVAITFADSKFTRLAQKQKDNFESFGVKHVTVPMEDQTYGIELWLKLLDLTVEAIETYGRIFRVDSEIRLLQELKFDWYDSNVLFHIDHEANIINTGHMILDRSALPFLSSLKEMTIAMIPPGYSGEALPFDDEDASYEAIKKSGIHYISEIIDYGRSDISEAACTRGSWSTDETIFTHPFIHNWDIANHNISAKMLFRNHFRPLVSARFVDGIVLGLEKKVNSETYWKKFGFAAISEDRFQFEEWIIDPLRSSFRNINYSAEKFILPSQP